MGKIYKKGMKKTMVKVLLFRVGIDTGNQKNLPLSPVFENGRFVFLPLIEKEGEDINKGDFIKELEKRFDIRLSKYLGKKYVDSDNFTCHYDPCFDFDGEFSYGDTSKDPKAHNLMKLNFGDYLFFCATMVKMKKSDYHGNKSIREIYNLQKLSRKKNGLSLYIFGFFKVLQKEIMNRHSPKSYVDFIKKEFKNNAHILRKDFKNKESLKNKNNLIFIKGDSKESYLLLKALRLGSLSKIKKKGNKRPTIRYKLCKKWRDCFDNHYISTRPYLYISNPQKFLDKIFKMVKKNRN